MTNTQRLSGRSKGQYKPAAWLEEGDGLIASSKVTRELWKDYRQEISEAVKDQKQETRDGDFDWSKLKGLPRASMLLLGYSVEMYLKAGLVKAYMGCSEEMFSRDVKNTFGHKLVKLAQEIHFCFEENDREDLNLLKNMVLIDARYPVLQEKDKPYFDAVNKQTRRIWSGENFDAFLNLANRIKDHTTAIDQDSNAPSYFIARTIDDDGYLAFREGGHLPPRITYRVSSIQEREKKTSLHDIKLLFECNGFSRLMSFWNQAWIFEDGRKKTILRQEPMRLKGISK